MDRWQIIDFAPPAFLRLDVGATPTGTGAPEGRRVGGFAMRNLNAITPETETTSHYFWGQAHDFDVKNPETTNKIFEQIQIAFYQDVAVFSAQQKNLNIFSNPPQVDINADAGVVAARRILNRLHDEEQASRASGGRVRSLPVRAATKATQLLSAQPVGRSFLVCRDGVGAAVSAKSGTWIRPRMFRRRPHSVVRVAWRLVRIGVIPMMPVERVVPSVRQGRCR